jgi:2-polyprenyl-6-methoxyphenol hydroxylase-like FAD-dependent oxidoreductase
MTTPTPLPNSATPLNILIVGAGVCGPTLALLLQRSNPKHAITVIERSPSLRTGGQQVDLKAQGVPIMRRLGLLGTLKDYCVKESGMELVDNNGKSLMQFGVTKAEEKGRTFELTSESEFMRGDFVRMMYDSSLQDRKALEAREEREGGLTYEFGKTVTALEQSSETVTVTFSSGETKDYDLVVAADGQGSRTRQFAFGEETSREAFKTLNIFAAYFNIPRLPSEDSLARIYFAPRSRMVLTRTGDRPVTQVYFFLLKEMQQAEKMRSVNKMPLEQQKEAWSKIYADAGWDCPRFLQGMEKVEDFYATEIGQVKMPEQQLHKGRVVLLGDAGYCPSAFTGMGTTLSLIGAYVLAGELARHGHNVDAALAAYDETMKQPIAECQELSRLAKGDVSYPTSEWGLWATNSVLWGMSALRVDKLLGWIAGFMPEGKQKRWQLPEYPELGLEEGKTF